MPDTILSSSPLIEYTAVLILRSYSILLVIGFARFHLLPISST
jgi:hypothetical protein